MGLLYEAIFVPEKLICSFLVQSIGEREDAEALGVETVQQQAYRPDYLPEGHPGLITLLTAVSKLYVVQVRAAYVLLARRGFWFVKDIRVPDWREAMAQWRLDRVALWKSEKKMKDASSVHAGLSVVFDEDRSVAMRETFPLVYDGFFKRAFSFLPIKESDGNLNFFGMMTKSFAFIFVFFGFL